MIKNKTLDIKIMFKNIKTHLKKLYFQIDFCSVKFKQ